MKRIIIVISVFVMLVACTNLSGETVKIVGVNGNIKILKFDRNISEINITKIIHKIKTIEGLSKFKNLKKLSINFSDLRDTDFSFLKEIKNLKILSLSFATLRNIDFINDIPSLIVFSCIETMDIEKLDIINLKNNKNLEYMGIYIDEMQDLPEIINIPESLKYVDFIDCGFRKMSLKKLSLLSSYSNVSYVFSDDIDECMRKLNLDINLFDNSKYDDLLKRYGIQ